MTTLLNAYLKHARYYLQVIREAHQLYIDGRDTFQQSLDHFDTNWPNIALGQAWSASHAQQSVDAAEICTHYPIYSFHLLNLRLTPAQHAKWLEEAYAATYPARELGIEGKIIGNLAIVYKNAGDADRAIAYSKQHVTIASSIGDQRSIASALCNIGLAYKNLGQFDQAIIYLSKSLEQVRSLGLRREEGIALGNLGIPFLKLSQYDQAITFFQAALDIAREVGDRRGEGADLCNLGLAYSGQGDHDKAICLFTNHIAIAREIGDRQGEANSLYNLSEEYASLGDLSSAIQYASDSLAIREGIDDVKTEKVRMQLNEWLGSI